MIQTTAHERITGIIPMAINKTRLPPSQGLKIKAATTGKDNACHYAGAPFGRDFFWSVLTTEVFWAGGLIILGTININTDQKNQNQNFTYAGPNWIPLIIAVSCYPLGLEADGGKRSIINLQTGH